MRQLTRDEVIQAFAVLGVRLSGVVDQDRFDEAYELVTGSQKRLMLLNHPDRHAANGHTKEATARSQEISAAGYLLSKISWFQVAGLFGAHVSRSTTSAHWNARSGVPSAHGAKFYVRCPMCGILVGAGEHRCTVRPDHFNTKSRPFSYERPWKREPQCRNESPLGAFCTEPPGHTGWHHGYGKQGRHSWHEASPDHSEETVEAGGTP